MERGTSGVRDTTATVAKLDAMCFLVSLEPVECGIRWMNTVHCSSRNAVIIHCTVSVC